MNACVRGTQRAIRCFSRGDVESRHRLRKVHGVVEPETTRSELGTGKLFGLTFVSMVTPTRVNLHAKTPSGAIAIDAENDFSGCLGGIRDAGGPKGGDDLNLLGMIDVHGVPKVPAIICAKRAA